MNNWLFVIPIISAVGGWLFQSLVVSRFLGYFPNRKILIAETLGEAGAGFISFDEIEKKISHPDNFKKILPSVEEHLEHFLRVKLKESMPMIGMLVGERTINQLKQVFIAELEALFPQIMLQYAGSLKEELNIKEIVKQKINNISNESIKSLIYQYIGPEIKKLKLYASFFGFIIGILQLGIIYLTL
jgi:uncharacterized membrane protein YheB (UPF0754 family)